MVGRSFLKSFLLADINLDLRLEMPFLTMSNTDIDFQALDLQWNSYTTRNVLLTTRQVELIGEKEFAIAILDPEYKIFIVYIATLSVDSGDKIHPSKTA